MRWVCLVLLLFARQLTWYEQYERGERAFLREEWQTCIADMDRALEEKPEPGRNVFTRAVQKIEYKPYYYKALAHYHLNELEAAYDNAQRAFQGEVVAGDPTLQSRLAPIFKSYRQFLDTMRADVNRQKEALAMRGKIFEALADEQLDEVVRLLETAELPEGEVQDIRSLVARQRNFEQQRGIIRQGVVSRIVDYLDEGSLEAASVLLEAMRGDLEPRQVENLQARLSRLRETREAQAAKDETPEQSEPDEPVVDPKLAEDLERFRNEIASLNERGEEMLAEIERKDKLNRNLEARLEEQAHTKPIAPKLFLTVEKLEGRRIFFEGSVFTPSEKPRLQVRLNQELLPADAFLNSVENGFSLSGEVEAPGFGSQELIVRFEDEWGGEDYQRKELFIPRPFYLNPWLWIALLALLILVAVYFGLRRVAKRRRAKLTHFNPYIAGSPIRRPEMFFGREFLLNRILQLVHKNSFMIHGERRIGKTSFLHQLRQRLHDGDFHEYTFYPVFIDLQGHHESDLFHHMMGEIVAAAADWEVETEDLDYQENLEEDYTSRKFAKDLKKIVRGLKGKSKKFPVIVLLMDEVDILNEFSDRTNQKLRGIFMKDFAEHLSCVMAGIHLKKEWDSAGSPWYNFFEDIPMRPFEENHARSLVEDPVRGYFQYQNDALHMILEKTGGHPYLIQKLCVKIIDRLLQENRFRIYVSDVEQALQELEADGGVGAPVD